MFDPPSILENLKSGQNKSISEEFSRYILSFINLNYLSSAFMQTPPVREKLDSEIKASEIRSASSSQCS
jgi:hypothetical protein